MDKNNRSYTNKDITLYWRPGECIHATTCYTKLLSVFNPRKRPWVDMDGAPTQKIIDRINECPTNALTFRWNDESKNQQEASHKVVSEATPEGFASVDSPEEDEKPVEVRIMPNGPILVSGDFSINDHKGVNLKKMQIASLCRCGHTNSPPFCDGNHFKIGFRDPQE